MTDKNFYTIWSWYEAPYAIRISSPLPEDQGTWIVRVEPGYGFPYGELNISERPDWTVEQKQIDGRWYTFIHDPEDRAWPPYNSDYVDWGGNYDNQPFSKSYSTSGTIFSEINFPPNK